MIGLVPEYMILRKGIANQYEQIMDNYNQVFGQAIKSTDNLSIVGAIVYLARDAHIDGAYEELKEDYDGKSVVVLRVEQLPRGAQIELSVEVQTHGDENEVDLTSYSRFNLETSHLPSDDPKADNFVYFKACGELEWDESGKWVSVLGKHIDALQNELKSTIEDHSVLSITVYKPVHLQASVPNSFEALFESQLDTDQPTLISVVDVYEAYLMNFTNEPSAPANKIVYTLQLIN